MSSTATDLDPLGILRIACTVAFQSPPLGTLCGEGTHHVGDQGGDRVRVDGAVRVHAGGGGGRLP